MHVHAVIRVHAVTPKLVICVMYLTSILTDSFENVSPTHLVICPLALLKRSSMNILGV